MPEKSQSASADISRVAETTRSARIDFTKVAPEAYQAMGGLQRYVRQSGLEQPLLELVRMRSSQINGCAYCIDMHSKDARGRRNRTAPVRPRCLARDSVLHRPRARSFGMDRSSYACEPDSCAGRGL